jgi:NAD(P)-dependent dehydrogenase (short-subunit alcohol dehydrogenase family)
MFSADVLRVLLAALAGSPEVDPSVALRVRLAAALVVLNVVLLAAVRARQRAAAPWGRFLGAGKWVLITGAGSGIGRQTALDLAPSGSSLALWDVNPGALADTAAAVAAAPGATGAVVTAVVDVSDAAAVAAAAATLLARTPDRLVDVVISNAGVVTGKDVHELSAADVRRCFGVNVEASFSLLRALLPPARAARRGCFVFVSSVMGLAGSSKLADYCSSKFALIGAVESLRMELARDGLRSAIPVVTVMPYAAG